MRKVRFSPFTYQPLGSASDQFMILMVYGCDKLIVYEVGKQTFNSLFSKAKAKYSEFQATSIAERDQPGRPKESAWGQRVPNERDQAWRQLITPTPMSGAGRGGQQDRQGRGMYGDTAS